MSSLQQNAPRQRPAGRSERIGRAVVEATMELLAEGGLRNLTFETLAERAEVNRTTLYRRWGNKSRLLTWVMLEYMARHAPTPDTGSLERDLLAVMMNLNQALASASGAAFLHVALVEARQDDAVAAAVRDFWRQRLALAKPIYDRAIERGEVEGNVDFEFLTDLVFGPFFYRILRIGKPINARQAKRIIESTLRSAGGTLTG